jgi:hypothetical protein
MPESSILKQLQSLWTPVEDPAFIGIFTGVTTFYETIKYYTYNAMLTFFLTTVLLLKKNHSQIIVQILRSLSTQGNRSEKLLLPESWRKEGP